MSSTTNSNAFTSFTDSTQNILVSTANDTSSINTDLSMAGNDSSASLPNTTDSSALSELSSGISIIDFAYVHANIKKNSCTKVAHDRSSDVDEQPAHKFKKLDSTRKARIAVYVRKQRADMSGGTNHQVFTHPSSS